jgi:hypothetical protein
MAIGIMENGNKIKWMEEENINLQEDNIQVILDQENSMVEEPYNIHQETNTKVNSSIIKKMEKVNYYLITETNMMEILLMTEYKDMVYLHFKMVKNIKDTSGTERKTDKELIIIETVTNFKEHI